MILFFSVYVHYSDAFYLNFYLGCYSWYIVIDVLHFAWCVLFRCIALFFVLSNTKANENHQQWFTVKNVGIWKCITLMVYTRKSYERWDLWLVMCFCSHCFMNGYRISYDNQQTECYINAYFSYSLQIFFLFHFKCIKTNTFIDFNHCIYRA